MLAGRTRIHRAALAAIALLAVAAPPAASADTATRTITVVGDATVKAPNDTARLSFRVETRGRTAAAALNTTSARARRVIAAIKATGVSAADIQTEELSLDRITIRKKHHPKRRVYRAVNSVSVTVRNIAKAGDAIAAAVNAGATGVSGVDFSSSKEDELYLQALADAYDRAKAKAQRLADRAGATLGAAQEINEGVVESDEGFAVPLATKGPAGAVVAPPVQPGISEIQATVTVTFAIS